MREALLRAFAEHDSESVQHTLYAMGQAVLDSVDVVASITLVMPNKHHLPVDLTPFGLENRNEIFVATEEPLRADRGDADAMIVNEPARRAAGRHREPATLARRTTESIARRFGDAHVHPRTDQALATDRRAAI